ncbi:molybdate ABC transporter substrate-binding protein [Halobacillus fulvus]|nr:molybdate ABC transporter substrate-binding protein [Halobacillus fulvus]
MDHRIQNRKVLPDNRHLCQKQCEHQADDDLSFHSSHFPFFYFNFRKRYNDDNYRQNLRDVRVKKILLLVIFLTLTGCSQASSENSTITISAAASLTDALDPIVELYEKEHDITIKRNVAGSGKLAQQIEQGAPVDLFLSANQKWMDRLEDNGWIDPSTRVTFAENQLVVIRKKGDHPPFSLEHLADLEASSKIALGEPESVPVGSYTKQALKTIQLWGKISEHRVFASDVRQVLAYVESGNAEYGFVYKSDTYISDQVEIAAAIDSSFHAPIVYPGAVVTDSPNQAEARDFLEFLQSPEVREMLHDYGFKTETVVAS